MSVNRASEVWKEIKPFALRDLKVLQNTKNADSAINSGYYIILYDQSSQKLRYYSASPTGLQAALAAAGAGDIVYLPAGTIQTVGGSSYTAGSELSSGAITVTNESGETVSGLDAGSLYAIASTGGPWNNGIGDLLYSIKISDDGGATWVEHANSGWVEYDESLGDNKQLFFRPSGSSIKVRVADAAGQFVDNTGSLGYSLKAASAIYPTIIPSGVEVAGIGENCILDGGVENNGMLTNVQVTGAITGTGSYHAFDSNSAWQTNRQIISDVATGTSPFEIASTTLNANLNADMVDGKHASEIGGQGSLKNNAVGTISHIAGNVTIIDNALHNGFPGACILADGTIIAVYRTATDHSSVNGSIKSKSSTDGGVTWSAESTIYTHATLDARDPSITRLRNGNLVLSVKLYNWALSKADYSVVLISTDNGATWGSAIAVGEAFTSYGGCSSPVVEMADNKLLLATFGLDTGDTYECARLVTSDDGGTTWSNIGTIAKSMSRHYQEPNLCVLPNGELLCFLRSNTVDHFYLCHSIDGGSIWSTPVDLFSAGGRPNIARLSNGTLFLCYRQKSIASDHTVYRISLDNGFNWGSEQVLDTSGIMAYSAVIEKNAGSFGVVFAVQQSTTNSDVFYTNYYSSSDFVPSLHASTHQSGGTDAIKIDDLAAPDDNTDLDASTTKHGLMMKFPGGTSNFLRSDGTFSAPAGGGDVIQDGSITAGHLAVFASDHHIEDGGSVPAGSSTDGWVSEANTWSYSSADAPSFVASVNADLTGKLSPGMRIKLTQTTVKYFIVTAVGAFSGGATLITLYGGTDYTLANAAITSPFLSTNKAPFGFPLDPAKWTVEVINSGSNDQANPTQNQWYNPGSISIVLPIGIWGVSYQLSTQANDASSLGLRQQVSLSTSNNSVSDANFTTNVGISSGTVQQISIYRVRSLVIASKTTYYLISMTATSGLDNLRIGSVGAASPTIIQAVCAYL